LAITVHVALAVKLLAFLGPEMAGKWMVNGYMDDIWVVNGWYMDGIWMFFGPKIWVYGWWMVSGISLIGLDFWDF